MSDVNGYLMERLGNILSRHVEPIFKVGTKLALIARTPGNSEADVLVTSDSIEELIALLERSKARDEVQPPCDATRNTLIRRDRAVQDRRFAPEVDAPTAFGSHDICK